MVNGFGLKDGVVKLKTIQPRPRSRQKLLWEQLNSLNQQAGAKGPLRLRPQTQLYISCSRPNSCSSSCSR